MGYDVISLDLGSGELRLIEVKGLSGATVTVLLTPDERRAAEDRPDCHWLHIVTNFGDRPIMKKPIRNPARFSWREVTRVQHCRLDVNTTTSPLTAREDGSPYGGEGS